MEIGLLLVGNVKGSIKNMLNIENPESGMNFQNYKKEYQKRLACITQGKALFPLVSPIQPNGFALISDITSLLLNWMLAESKAATCARHSSRISSINAIPLLLRIIHSIKMARRCASLLIYQVKVDEYIGYGQWTIAS
ncbi:hypothetical protein [Paenibacillus sp. KS-LC4]|uniref:hypothetical protein n=1 Tax=Paenibacillus sp. KS-LC4 TaxID=2979727 RepID=UPI0030CAFB62